MGSYTFASSFSILQAAGAYVDSSVSGSLLLSYSDQAEALLNAICKVDLVAAYPSLSTNFKQILEDFTVSYAGLKAKGYNIFSFPNLAGAQTESNILRDNVERIIELIKEDRWKKISGSI